MIRGMVLTALVGCVAAECWAAVPASHAAEMRYLDNGTIRLGADLNLGGAVTFLAPSGTEKNLINSWDWGRQIQMSYYSGPVPFTPNGKQPAPQWRGLGWNPIQAGDHFGHSSKTVESKVEGATLYVKCVPMQWPLENEPGECTFETWYTLEGPVVKVRSRLNNRRIDGTQWPARTQELPAVYTNGPWYRLMTYSGDAPFTGGALTRIEHPLGKDGKPWASWHATEQWAALVDDADWGLGVWNAQAAVFSGGFAGKPGVGGAKDGPTGYIAPNRQEILDANIVHEYEYRLIVGDLKAIRAYVVEHAKQPGPPDYRFEADRRGWWYTNAVDAGWPVRGELNIRLDRADPQLHGPGALWRAEDAPVLRISCAVKSALKGAEVFWSRLDGKGATPVGFELTPDGEWHTYEVRLAGAAGYEGMITSIRFDPVAKGAEGDWIKVRRIGFGKGE